MQRTVNDMYNMAMNYSEYPNDDPSSSYLYEIFSCPDNEEKPFDKTGFLNYLRYATGYFQIRDYDYSEFCSHLVAWSHVRLPSWQRVYDALCADYNPLENYDMRDNEHIKEKKHDDFTSKDEYGEQDSSEHNQKHQITNDDTRTDTLYYEHIEGHEDTNQKVQEKDYGYDETSVAGYDSGDLVSSQRVDYEHNIEKPYDDNKTHTENEQDSSHNQEIHDDKTQKEKMGETSTYNENSNRGITNQDDEKNRSDRHQYKHGNIGVMSSQQLVQQEIDLALQNSIYSIMTDEFKNEFCLLVY